MVAIQSEIKRGFLRALWRSGQKAALSLKEVLEAFQDAGYGAVKGGRVVVNASGSGHSASYEVPHMARGFTQEQVFALSELFIQIYQDTNFVLCLAEDGPDDETLFTAMLADDRMQSITQTQLDVLGIRFGE